MFKNTSSTLDDAKIFLVTVKCCHVGHSDHRISITIFFTVTLNNIESKLNHTIISPCLSKCPSLDNFFIGGGFTVYRICGL